MKSSYLQFLIILAISGVVLFGNSNTNKNLGASLDEFSVAHATLWIPDLKDRPLECQNGIPNPLLVPLPGQFYLQDYEKELFDFILRRQYDTDLNWCVDKRVRDTGPFVQGKYYGIHPAVRIYYSPRIMYWLTGDPAYWKEGKVKKKKPREGPVPPGAMIVKEMFQSPAELYEELRALFSATDYTEAEQDSLYEELLDQIVPNWTIMVKADNHSKDDWFWAGVSAPKENQSIEEAVNAQLDNYDHMQYSSFGQSVCLRCHGVAEDGYTFIAERNVEGLAKNENLLRFFTDDSWRDSSYLDAYPLSDIFDGKTPLDSSLAKQLLWLPPELRPWVDQDDPEWANFINRHQFLVDSTEAEVEAPRLPSVNPEFVATFLQIPGNVQARAFPSQWADHVVPGAKTTSQYITSDNCLGCHGGLGGDPPDVTMFLQTGPEYGDGYNVSEYGEWRWSPMGLAGRDPIFYAQLESEMAILKQNAEWDSLHPDQKPLLHGPLKTNQEQVTSTCLSCHGAMGQRQLKLDAREDKTLDSLFRVEYVYLTEALTSKQRKPDNYKYHKYGELAREGISCTVCHHINAPDPSDIKQWNPGDGWLPPEDKPEEKELAYMLFHNTTGQYVTGPADELNGPFKDVRVMPMENVLGITPMHSEFIKNSQLCGNCHTINLPNIGMEKDEFPVLTAAEQNPALKPYSHTIEQATFLEWQNSAFGQFAQPGEFQSCQDCHMPGGFKSLDGSIDIEQLTTKIATIQDNSYPEVDHTAPESEIEVPHRTDYQRHEHVGLNVFLLEMFNQFPEVLGVSKKDEMTYATTGNALAIENMIRQARESTIDLNFQVENLQRNRLKVDVEVKNKTGHRFPSGVSFRRAFIEFLVLEGDDVIWGSGRTNSVGVIVDEKGRPLETEFLDVKSGDTVLYQPHHQVITSQQQVQIYEELNQNRDHEFTTSFIHRVHPIKDNRLLPKGWRESSFFASEGKVIEQFMAATDPHAVGNDPDYEDRGPRFAGQDRLTYDVTLPRGTDLSNLSVKVTVYYQSIPPYFLNQRFTLAPDGEATQRLFYLTSHLNLDSTPMKDWKLPLVSKQAIYCEDTGEWE